MSGCMKKKHIFNEILNSPVEIKGNQELVKVLKTQGNHLYEVQTTRNERFLTSLPMKFRNTIWVKPGSFVVIEPIAEGNKVKGEIVKILLKDHIKEMKKNPLWLNEFNTLDGERSDLQNLQSDEGNDSSESE